MENGLVFLCESKSAVGVSYQGFKVASGGSVTPTWPPSVFTDSTVAIHAEHVSALAEQKNVVGMVPAIAHDRIRLCMRTVGIVGVVGQIKINSRAVGILDGGNADLFLQVTPGERDGTSSTALSTTG